MFAPVFLHYGFPRLTFMNTAQTDYMPYYIKIQNFILQKIATGEYKQGDKIPSENELARQFSVSRITANAAIKELSTMGVVERIKGKGTFVADIDSMPSASKVFSNNLKIETMQIFGNKKHFVVEAKIAKPNEMVKERFSMTDSDLVYEIVRLIYHKSQPACLDYSYIPLHYLSNVTIDMAELENHYLHDYLKMHTNCNPKYVKLFINTPCYPFYDLSLLNLNNPNDALIWNTDILNDKNQLVSTTTTITSSCPQKPFITFAL